ncbi:hypothetical protein [Pectinatus sottacetonis]|uniref:hypothetical protein n=1 Tax=Pectinatus sottacetonis TaxID=1002795 RepID=UPI0018C5B39C|nr:hypothetical protein [Pectinatus sottacetonis]
MGKKNASKKTADKAQTILLDIFNNIAIKQPVMQLTANYNWGPPVAGRCDGGDFLDIYIATNIKNKNTSVHVYGKNSHTENWSIIKEDTIKHTADFNGEYDLYELHWNNQYNFPEEYVIMVDDGTGNLSYDNNQHHNFQLRPYSGHDHIASVIVAKNVIYKLAHNVNYHSSIESSH